jgi:hypothetical protein
MKRLLILLMVTFSPWLLADERTIELVDGSRIKGELVSLQNGKYTVRTESLGTVTLNQSQIVNISSGTPTNTDSRTPTKSVVKSRTSTESDSDANSGTSTKDTISAIQGTIAADAGLMRDILKLQNDPDMQAVIADPEIMKAVQELDLESLARNPKIKALMNNATMREIQAQSGKQ